MKRFLVYILCFGSVLAVFSCHNKDTANNTPSDPNQLSQNLINVTASAGNNPNGKLPKLVFADSNHDFGEINEGDKVSCSFHFKNAGESDLIITGATAGCSCTTPSYPKEIKHPGDTGTISVTFDSKDKQGKVTKVVTVTSNSQPILKYLTINANIKPSNK